jgi:RNA polymerase sigma factor (sigma-70 family)
MSVDSGDGHSEQWDLAPQLRGDDPRELAYLYDNYAAYLFDYCEDVLQDHQDAAGAVRDTLVAAYASVGAMADQERLRSWLYAIARRQWPAYSQQQAAGRPAQDGDWQAGQQPGPDFAASPEYSGDQPTAAASEDSGDLPPAAGQEYSGDQEAAAGLEYPRDQQQRGEHPYPAETGTGEAGPGVPGPAGQERSADPANQAGTDDLVAALAAGLAGTAAEDGTAGPHDLTGYDTDEFAALTPDEQEREEIEARQRETMTVVSAAFDGLAGPDREVLNLAYRHGIIGTDLAATLGVPDRQVRVRLTGAVSRFSQAADVIIILYLGWTRCRALEEIAGDWNPASGRLDHDVLQALIRHAGRCQRCKYSSGYTVYGPELLAGIPLAMPPPGLRRQVIAVAHDAGLDEYRAEVVARLGVLGADGFPLPPRSRALRTRPPGSGGHRRAVRPDRQRRRLPLVAAAISALAAAAIVAVFLVFRLVTTSAPGPARPAVPLQAADASPGSKLDDSARVTTPGQAGRPSPGRSTAPPPGLLGPTQPVITPPPLPEPQPTQTPSPRHSPSSSPSPVHSNSPKPPPTPPPSSPPPSPSPSPTPTPAA